MFDPPVSVFLPDDQRLPAALPPLRHVNIDINIIYRYTAEHYLAVCGQSVCLADRLVFPPGWPCSEGGERSLSLILMWGNTKQ